MDKLDFSEYGQDLFLNTFENIKPTELNQSQGNCASCCNSAGGGGELR